MGSGRLVSRGLRPLSPSRLAPRGGGLRQGGGEGVGERVVGEAEPGLLEAARVDPLAGEQHLVGSFPPKREAKGWSRGGDERRAAEDRRQLSRELVVAHGRRGGEIDGPLE